jgi:hypothetical protein
VNEQNFPCSPAPNTIPGQRLAVSQGNWVWHGSGATRSKAPTWLGAGPILEEKVVQSHVGVLHTCTHCLKHHLQGAEPTACSLVYTALGMGNLSPLPAEALTLQASSACTSTLPSRQVNPP